jgi:hypothetical protein
MVFGLIVALRAVRLAFTEALGRPNIVGIFRQPFGQLDQLRRKCNSVSVNWVRLVALS